MTKPEAVDVAKHKAMKYDTFYVVFHDPEQGGYHSAPLKAVNVVFKRVRSTDYEALVRPDGRIDEL